MCEISGPEEERVCDTSGPGEERVYEQGLKKEKNFETAEKVFVDWVMC